MKYYDIIIDQKVEKHIESIIKYVAYDLYNKQAALMAWQISQTLIH